ncbi:MAG: dTDP-4-dehydrorhamnose 3,5-epimerase [Pseudomonadota bacterium]
MKIIETDLPGVLLIEPKVVGDPRGFFVETFREEWLHQAGQNLHFVQDNQSRSRQGVLRGLHYQLEQPQGKLVRCARGAVFDVAVDVRRGSPHFGRWTGAMLDDVTHRQIYIPPGFAHGFCVLSDEADFVYKCTDYYHAPSEAGVAWNDPAIGIAWPALAGGWLLSERDKALPKLADQPRLPAYAPQ